MTDDKPDANETERPSLKKKPVAPPKPYAQNGKPNRADGNKGKQQKPAKQRIQRHQGR